MVAPCEQDGTVEAAEEIFKKINIPFYTGSVAYAYTYKLHWRGAQHYFQNIKQPQRKLLFTGPAHLERPFHEYHDEIIRWYDHWLKGQRNHGRTAGALLADGRQRMADRRRLAAPRDAGAEAVSQRLRAAGV